MGQGFWEVLFIDTLLICPNQLVHFVTRVSQRKHLELKTQKQFF